VQLTPVRSSGPSPSFVKPCLDAIRFLTVLLLTIFMFCSLALSQQDVITEIDIHGNRRIPAETVRARIFSRVGDVYDQAAIERDFNSLWNTGYFEDIRFEREQTPKGWRLHIYVKERPTIREIDYVGLSSVSKSDVLDRFKDAKVGLSPESQYDPTKVKKAEVTIKGLLAEHGRQFATVRTEIRPIPPAAVSLTFVIKEGPKVKVGNIIFQGNKNVNSRTLRAAMKNLKPIGIPHSIFLENLFSKTYDATKLDEDTERVRAEYQNRGYFKVVVQDPTTKIHDTGRTGFHIPLLQAGPGKAVDITMAIEEGDRYNLGGITFKNNKAFNNPKALRSVFPIKDGDVFDRDKVAKGLEALRKAYGGEGYINFTSIPNTTFDEAKKLVFLEIDVDEGKKFSVRRIEFSGNTTTRDRVIRREIILEEGQPYNQRLWEISLQRLNQLGYFEQLKPDDPNVTDRHLDEKEGTVDLTLKVKEKGKNSIGLTGGVSGLAGAFVGLSYSTNNFLGLGETLTVQANIGNLQRDLVFGFTEPYLKDRPLQFGFQVYARKSTYDQARQEAIFSGQSLNLPSALLQNLQNYTQSSKGFSTSLAYPLHHSFKRLGLSYSYDVSSLVALTTASKSLFNYLAFSGISGPSALDGIVTSKLVPSYSKNTLDAAISPHSGSSYYIGGEFSGLGGTVKTIRPVVQYKRFIPVQNRRNTIGFNVQASFLTGFDGLVAPPFQRSYMGGENDLRGFDIRSVSPVAFLPATANVVLRNPDGSIVPKDPSNPARGSYTIPVPVDQIVFPGGDASLVTNLEYRVTIAGPVALAPFMDLGIDPILRNSQLRINTSELGTLNGTIFGCPSEDPISFTCIGGVKPGSTKDFPFFSQNLTTLGSTNWVPRMSTGLELQVFLPVVNAPFRIYWAYNPLRLDTISSSPVPITTGLFPFKLYPTASAYTYQLTKNAYSPQYLLREPRKTFRFSVATTF
jgi:outer membrane protein insertion porin family